MDVDADKYTVYYYEGAIAGATTAVQQALDNRSLLTEANGWKPASIYPAPTNENTEARRKITAFIVVMDPSVKLLKNTSMILTYLTDVVDVPDDDEQGDQQVADGHDRYDDAAYFGDAVDAAEDDDQRNDRQDKAYHQRVEAESDIEGAADGVALNGVVRQAEGHGNQDGEECRQPGLLESLEDIIGRSADKMMLFPALE